MQQRKKKVISIEEVKQEESHRRRTFFLYSSNISFYGIYEDSEFIKKGYSNDHHIDLKQIRLQLFTLHNSIPVFFSATPGNRVDKNSLDTTISQFESLLDALQDKNDLMDLENVSLVIDRGYVSKENLFYLDDNRIRALRRAG